MRFTQAWPRWLPKCLVLLCAIGAAGCGTRAVEKEEHEEAVRTGPHGGALVTLSPEAVRSAGIAVDSVGPRSMEIVVELPGEIKLNAERSVDVRPAYPGRVRSLQAGLGSVVRRGQPIAVIYSNESLSDYTIEAPMSGRVVSRPVNPGAAVDAQSVLYTLADLSTVWLDFPIYVQHLGRIRAGQSVHVRAEGGPLGDAVGTIGYVGPVLDVDTRTTFGRVVLPNRGGRWQPGRLVTAAVVLERIQVPLAVPEDAIVRMGSGAAVFRAESDGFEMQPVTVGRSDGAVTEIVAGLDRGARVVVRNAFLLKAELEKEAGGHED
jgi:membrane fusion protein, heavy metal efflux system